MNNDKKVVTNDEEEKVFIKLKKHRPQKKFSKKLVIILCLIFLVSVVFTGISSYYIGFYEGFKSERIANKANDKVELNDSLKKFKNIYNILNSQWYFSRNLKNPTQEIIDNAIKGMLEKNGDEYTSYMTKEEYDSFIGSINQNFSGIGVVYTIIDSRPIIQRVLNNSPAAKAGVMVGDIINKVNNIDVSTKSSNELSSLVRGEKGSTVTIEFLRNNATVTLNIIRDVIHATADSRMITDNIGLLEINSFGEDTGTEVKEHLNSLLKSGAKKLIIDVRNNGGGFLNAVEEIASLFLASNQIIIQQELVDGSITTSYSKGNVIKGFDKIVMLANKHSASSSEVLLAALNENLNIPIFGQTSYGKGVAQTLVPFDDGSFLKYTYSQWLTPNGNKINGVGVKPTHPVKLHPVFEQQLMLDNVDLKNLNIKVDSVSEVVTFVQYALDYLGYSVDRFDGYFSTKTRDALVAYQKQVKLDSDGVMNGKTVSTLLSSVMAQQYLNQDVYDLELKEAVKYLKNEK